jgi:hypothetical protein
MFLRFILGGHPIKRRRKAEDAIEHAPPGLAITTPELAALRRHLHRQVSIEAQAFWQDLRNEQQKMEEREREFAQRRRRIESRHAARLLQERRQIPTIDWKNPPDFEGEADRKLHNQNLAELDRQFSPEAFLGRLVPSLCDFASCVAIFEHPEMPGIPRSKKRAPKERVVTRILEMMFPRTPVQDLIPPEAKAVRVSEEKVWKGKVIAGPIELLLDERRRPIDYRRALYAERRGEFEHLPIGDLWGLPRAMKKSRRFLRQTLQARLLSNLVEMASDRRSRKQMVEDCQGRHAGYGGHGISHKDIAGAARVSLSDFYQWRDNHPRIGPKKHRRVLFVVCSPVWPPPQI